LSGEKEHIEELRSQLEFVLKAGEDSEMRAQANRLLEFIQKGQIAKSA
jgi:hypothetical protein